jgi:hypothetical protein
MVSQKDSTKNDLQKSRARLEKELRRALKTFNRMKEDISAQKIMQKDLLLKINIMKQKAPKINLQQPSKKNMPRKIKSPAVSTGEKLPHPSASAISERHHVTTLASFEISHIDICDIYSRNLSHHIACNTAFIVKFTINTGDIDIADAKNIRTVVQIFAKPLAGGQQILSSATEESLVKVIAVQIQPNTFTPGLYRLRAVLNFNSRRGKKTEPVLKEIGLINMF